VPKTDLVTCPIYPGHRRSGPRLSPLDLLLPNRPTDFLWTAASDCLIQDDVLEAFNAAGVTGFAAHHAKARFRRPQPGAPPVLWELKVIGWGGMARPESGIALDASRSCQYCGHLVYSRFTNPAALIDPSAWDGSDVFIVWPLPRYIMFTEKAAAIIRREEFTGTTLLDLAELEVSTGSLSPGRLSYWFPEEAARRLGLPLGIE